MGKIYNVYEQIGNFANLVFTSEYFDDIQEYLESRLVESDYNVDDESEVQLFYSYFTIEEVEELEEKIIAAMAAAGYDYDDIDSYDECLVFRGNFIKTEFSSWDDALEWLEYVVFDDPELSDNVERIMHPERF